MICHFLDYCYCVDFSFRGVSYELNDWTSHLLAVYIFIAQCVCLDKFKGKGFPNKS